jgi:hypothetical protein
VVLGGPTHGTTLAADIEVMTWTLILFGVILFGVAPTAWVLWVRSLVVGLEADDAPLAPWRS